MKTARSALIAAVFLISWQWYGWLSVPQQIAALSLAARALLGLLPIILVLLITGIVFKGRIWALLAVAAGVILGQPVAYYPSSPDMAFHLGKVLWASRSMLFVDPAMGFSTPYPWLFHAIWGGIASMTHTQPIHLLRFASLFNVAGIIGVAIVFSRHLESRDGTRWLPWLCCLPLIAKDVSHILMATPSTFSMPIALAGWWGFASARSARAVVLSAAALVVAAAFWPGQLFGMAGVTLVLLLTRPRAGRTLVVGLATAGAAALTILMRVLATGSIGTSGESQFLPSLSIAWSLRVLRHIVSLGGDANGWLVAVACSALTLLLCGLAILGLKPARESERLRLIPAVVAGLLIGTAGSIWFMVQPAFWSRLASMTGFAVVPLAAAGIRRLPQVTSLRPTFIAWAGRLSLGGVWLIPFLAASLVNTNRAAQWPSIYGPTTAALNRVAEPSDRVWASPETLTHVVMGRLPMFGFLGHRWARYYAAPADEADSIGNVYYELSQIGTPPVDTYQELRSHGVDFVVLSRDEFDLLPLGRTLRNETNPIWHDSNYTIFSMSIMQADVENPPAP